MRQVINKCYYVFWIVFSVFVVFAWFGYSIEIKQKYEQSGYQKINDYEVNMIENEQAPLGIEKEYVFPAEGISGAYRELFFYTMHQNVKVYVGDECVYSMEYKGNGRFGRTPGCLWNDVVLQDFQEGQTIRIVVAPVYKSTVDSIPEIYMGCKYDIVRDVLMANALLISISVGDILIGFLFMFYVLYNYRKMVVDRSLFMLGMFAVQLGLWKITDTDVDTLLLGQHPTLSIIPYIALMLIVIPFIAFLREMHSSREHWIWDVPCVLNILYMMGALPLQLLGIADMREILLGSHVILLLLAVITIIMIIKEVRAVGWNGKQKRNIICLGFCFVGMVLDLIIYYINYGRTIRAFGMLGFSIYIVVLGMAYIKECRELISIGMRAKRYEQMAYHDQLTGLYNRTAYAEHVAEADFSPENCIVAMFDLNGLKKCNDTLGHEMGDVYIQECAHLIQEVFRDVAQCYRMGGDEFSALIQGCGYEVCRKRMEQLQERVRQRNEKHTDIWMEIAYGFEKYDRRVDYDIGDTLRRADRMMYLEKYAMKHAQEASH